MTEKLYLRDSYLREFTAEVTALDQEKNGVQLDRTALYPGGGGQLCDTGVLHSDGNSYRISKVVRGDWHIVDGDLAGARLSSDWRD